MEIIFTSKRAKELEEELSFSNSEEIAEKERKFNDIIQDLSKKTPKKDIIFEENVRAGEEIASVFEIPVTVTNQNLRTKDSFDCTKNLRSITINPA